MRKGRQRSVIARKASSSWAACGTRRVRRSWQAGAARWRSRHRWVRRRATGSPGTRMGRCQAMCAVGRAPCQDPVPAAALGPRSRRLPRGRSRAADRAFPAGGPGPHVPPAAAQGPGKRRNPGPRRRGVLHGQRRGDPGLAPPGSGAGAARSHPSRLPHKGNGRAPVLASLQSSAKRRFAVRAGPRSGSSSRHGPAKGCARFAHAPGPGRPPCCPR